MRHITNPYLPKARATALTSRCESLLHSLQYCLAQKAQIASA
jgi:hypothetical protein